jgi:hypothetical protein
MECEGNEYNVHVRKHELLEHVAVGMEIALHPLQASLGSKLLSIPDPRSRTSKTSEADFEIVFDAGSDREIDLRFVGDADDAGRCVLQSGS